MLTRTGILLIYGTLIMLYLFSKNYAKGTATFVGTVRNLTVKVAQEGKLGINTSGLHEPLKLDISWLPPYGEKMPSSYSVIVTGIAKANHTATTECPEDTIFYTSTDNSQLSVLLPHSSTIADIPEMHILPNCTYRVQVFANPRTKSAINSEIIYTVPECIGHRCSCANANITLPVPKVNVILEKEDILVKWSVSTDDSHVHRYVISVGVPLLTSRNGLPVYNVTKLGDVPAKNTTFLWKTRNDHGYGHIETGYKIMVKATNSYECFGMEGNFIVHFTSSQTNLKDRDIWFVLGGLILICIFFGGLTLAFFFGKVQYGLVRTTTSLRAPTISTCKSQWMESVLQKRNVLYISAEFETEYSDETDKLQIEFKSVSLDRELGKGQFGKVYLGRLDNTERTLVAVKTSQYMNGSDESETHRQFIEEIEIMKAAGPHPHLVRLLGYCIQPDKPICIILEYMQGGDLLAFLHARRRNQQRDDVCVHRNSAEADSRGSVSETLYTTISSTMSSDSTSVVSDKRGSYDFGRFRLKYSSTNAECKNTNVYQNDKIGTREFLKFAMDIAAGMQHLEVRGIVHRDLAARNVLLDSNWTLKISDFGLSRNGIYVIRNTRGKVRHLPIRWMSPEAMRDRAFSSKSDVWSFGVVLWEIGTLGSFPYSNVHDDRLYRHIICEKGRLERPDDVSSDIYEMMRSCWATEPEARPNFAQLLLELRNLVLTQNLDFVGSTDNPCYGLSFPTENT